MSAEKTVTEEELEEVFRDDPEFGLTLLHVEFKDVILRCIKKKAWALGLSDWLDVYQETMMTMIAKVREPGFDPRRPLRLVQVIACRKAIDHLRRKGHRVNTQDDSILPHIAADLKNTDLGFEWQSLGPADWKEFRKALHEVIALLPDRQREVAMAYVDHYEDFKERDTYLPLAEAVGRITGKKQNVVAVKSAWIEARRKIAEALTKRGFNFLFLERSEP
jgi:DNA-directed RNA polymerase specialized sigma24 family protein